MEKDRGFVVNAVCANIDSWCLGAAKDRYEIAGYTHRNDPGSKKPEGEVLESSCRETAVGEEHREL